jgi:hypothetical protein
MGIEIIKDGDDVISVNIDGEELQTDGRSFIVPKSFLLTKKINDLPFNLRFSVCERIEGGITIYDSVPFDIIRNDTNKITIIFDELGRRKYWDGDIGYKLWMETKREIVSERQKESNDLFLDYYEDDGDYINLTYHTDITLENLADIIDLAYQIPNEIDGAAELTLGISIQKIDETSNERQFVQNVVIPVLRKLNFKNVRYSHGTREFGRDILFCRMTEFDEFEYWGAQVKYGDISGGANSEIDKIIGQIDDAFKMPFYDVYNRRKEKISKLLIVISGHFTENAIEKICEKIEIAAIKNNIVFIDGAKIDTMVERFRK